MAFHDNRNYNTTALHNNSNDDVINATDYLATLLTGTVLWSPRTVLWGTAATYTGGTALIPSPPHCGTRVYHLRHHPAYLPFSSTSWGVTLVGTPTQSN